MAYSIRVDRIGAFGVPDGASRTFEAQDEMSALAIAAREVDGGKPGVTRAATVSDPAGRLLFTYSGRAGLVRT
jgi:hypothetical protein